MTAALFICAFALSGIAAFYSILGLVAIFAAAPVPIAAMGSVLEVSKLVVASWLYRSWSDIPALMKAYFTSSLLILMFITSMGIFGFLSKAHVEQHAETGGVEINIELIDQRIAIQEDNIAMARLSLQELQKQIDRYTELGAVTKGVEARKNQQAERQTLLQDIEAYHGNIMDLNQEKSQHTKKMREIEVEIGPIKYLAAMVYGDQINQSILDTAVRWFIILIVTVFDPLAVTMLIAANWTMLQNTVLPEPETAGDGESVNPRPPKVPPQPTRAPKGPSPPQNTNRRTGIRAR